MTQNILITGAAGYIGGSILADFLSRTSSPIKDSRIYATVRSEEQAQRLSKIDGVNVIQVDLSDEASVSEAVLRNEIDIVLHIASSMATQLAANLINALGERRKASGAQTYFVQSSVTALLSIEGGWPYGEVKDTDAIFEKEKEIGGPNPVRQTNILVTELAKAQGVTSFNVALPHVYGTGSGEWSKLSSSIPTYVRTSIAHKQVYKFDVEGRPPAVHISDLVSLYALLTTKILQKEPMPSGEQGHYFGFNHRSPYWAVMDRIATSLHARGLVADASVKTWPSYKMAAEAMSLPELYIRAMCTSTGDLVPVNAYKIGWQPEWTEERYLADIDAEVQAALDLDMIKSSRYDTLLSAEK
ncbi:NAD(P)-binding protein [Zopfia rhizophila CBS 207.26]|uniref:NAD(P)-binding protein n=1 Tax=Zopfia rhizophila CBS 207.26 TaxID=1314779 RepID=A0A6A6DRL7_9PEZI|nr:NAD(P)-binding protein [Zopfia rhizophila CBS 207.26]